ncbi:MAG: glycosyltransferase family 2 protein [Patescibacteria group bacterium]
MPEKFKKISIIIPAYNEERTLAQIIENVKKVDLFPLEVEVIVVDNNSTDKTLEIAKNLRKNNPSIKVFVEKEKGKGSAVKKGLSEATGDLILIQDADLEYNPADIPKLLEKATSEKVIVYGSRNLNPEQKRKGGLLAHLGVWFLTKEFNLLFDTNLTDLWTCYKLFPKEASVYFKNGGFESELVFATEIVKNGFQIVEVPISYNNPRTKKEGKKITYSDGIAGIFILLREKFRK